MWGRAPASAYLSEPPVPGFIVEGLKAGVQCLRGWFRAKVLGSRVRVYVSARSMASLSPSIPSRVWSKGFGIRGWGLDFRISGLGIRV